ncbi:MAG: SPOR domain-containing protein [Campylobacterota bacterium]|nr:SPOR domain-containing protein [Campylobacterota bacterium]
MEVDGKEFLRNIGIEENKMKLEKEQKKLDESKRDPFYKNELEENFDNDSAYVDLSDDTESTINHLQDIMLNPDANNKNKKKYIVLGLSLILLFIVTIFVIRIISNSDEEKQLSTPVEKTQEIDKDKLLDKIDTKEEYEKVISKNTSLPAQIDMPDVKEPEPKDIILPPKPVEKPHNVKIEKKPEPKQLKKDLFELEKKETTQKIQKEVTKKVEKTIQKAKFPDVIEAKPRKVSQLPTPKETNFAKKSTSAPSGYYVQIGAYSKKPSDNFLNSIEKKGYNYTVHTIVVKGKKYNKVLIGAYPTKKTAMQKIDKIKKDFKNPKAYILKF